MMAKNVTITVPDELKADLEHYKKRLEISAVCSAALRRAVEDLRVADQQNDAMKDTVARLRAQRLSRGDSERARGYRDGMNWAMKEATYEQIKNHLASDLVRDIVMPKPVGEVLGDALWMSAGGVGKEPEGAYDEGFTAGVRAVWKQIEDAVER